MLLGCLALLSCDSIASLVLSEDLSESLKSEEADSEYQSEIIGLLELLEPEALIRSVASPASLKPPLATSLALRSSLLMETVMLD